MSMHQGVHLLHFFLLFLPNFVEIEPIYLIRRRRRERERRCCIHALKTYGFEKKTKYDQFPNRGTQCNHFAWKWLLLHAMRWMDPPPGRYRSRASSMLVPSTGIGSQLGVLPLLRANPPLHQRPCLLRTLHDHPGLSCV